ncbi:DUF4959 domain-containing protein [Desertivirga xinjiangensis]|uniref:DUF4959 domain-containing protein n=1 Tax=Desertivirga xinjiangensis TaxID=539206 RepID=UPI00210CF958|nr:DUF4959 domain-containing protein [Pedobacter xinjiangensis]
MRTSTSFRFSANSMLILMIIALFTSCKKSESPVEVISTDKTKPDGVTDVKVENLNGAAQITYKLPDSKNILYILARYNINDSRVRESKTSYYRDTIIAEGFAEEKEYDVTLYTVSRANVMSDPIVVKVHPKTPNYILINEGLEIAPDFGGASFIGSNPNKVPVSVHLMAFNDATGKYEEQEPEYISGDKVDLSIRGFDPREHKFGVYTTDRYGNVSPTRYTTLTPFFETLLDKSKFYTYKLPSDSPIGYGWEFRYFFDGNLGDPGWHTLSAPTKQGTFGLGVTAKISRFVLWNRLPDMFGYQNPRKITIWGSLKDNPQDSALPKNSDPGTVAGDWVNMGNFTFPDPPSGLPGNQANAADNAFAAAGINFKMPSSSPLTKFIRFECTQTWGGLDYINAMEISVYGSPQ